MMPFGQAPEGDSDAIPLLVGLLPDSFDAVLQEVIDGLMAEHSQVESRGCDGVENVVSRYCDCGESAIIHCQNCFLEVAVAYRIRCAHLDAMLAADAALPAAPQR